MRKGFAVLILSLGLIYSNVYADNIITYGKSTFEDVDNRIIFGSYGDEYSISEFGKLGGNDFIAELNFKNVLAYEGYTEAYDYNPTYDGYYDSFYKKPLPTAKDLTKISIRGLGANPREVQDVYVLTSEYEKYSSQEQDVRIKNNEQEIFNNAGEIIRVEDKSIDRDNVLGDLIDTNTDNIITNTDSITSNYNENKTQDLNIKTNKTNIDNNARKIESLDNRVNKLYGTQYCVEVDARILDTKRLTILPYIKHNFTINNNEIGVKFVVKLGKSYEEKLINKQNERLERLERKLGMMKWEGAVTVGETKDGKAIVQMDNGLIRIGKEF